MTASLFIAFVCAVASVLLAIAWRWLPLRTALGITIGLPLWLLYVGWLGYAGVLRAPGLRPPGIAYVLIPAVLFVFLAVVRSRAGGRIATAIPLVVLVAVQSYRIGVELFFHQLWLEGLVPRMLTFAGANIDIWIGLTAPLAAWASTRGRPGLRITIAWCALGLVALANVAVRSALTAPGPFNGVHAEVPNLAIGTFPFMFIPGFLAPLAVALHVLAIRAAASKLRITNAKLDGHSTRGAAGPRGMTAKPSTAAGDLRHG